jgi:hypothetical protein
MKLWIGAEMDADVADAFRVARIRVEAAVNRITMTKSYDLPVNGWDCIAIVRADKEFPERVSYSLKHHEMDFRLRIDHSRFKVASPHEQELMLFTMLRRSIELLVKRLPSAVSLEELQADLRAAEASL